MIKMERFKKILVATDGSEFSESALGYAIELAKKNYAKLFIVYVVPLTTIGSAWEDVEIRERLMQEGKEILEKAKEKVRERGMMPEVVLESGVPSEKILEVAKDKNVDLIVMGSHGHTKLEKIFIGSVAERVIAEACCPVLVLGRKKK